MKKERIVIISLFICFILFVFFSFFIREPLSYSEIEKRKLQQKPELSISDIFSGDYMLDFEKYIDDQMIGRNTFIKISSYFQYLLGKSELNDVIIGKDGYLFSKLEMTEEEENQLNKNIDFLNRFSNEYNNVSFMLIPTSEGILTDKLPIGYKGINQSKLISDIYSKVNMNNIDCFSLLYKKNKEYIYYKTDHHWNLNGAFYGYKSLCEGLKAEVKDISNYSFETLDREFKGTTYSKINILGENEILYKIEPNFEYEYEVVINNNTFNVYNNLYFEEYLDSPDKYSVYLSGNQAIVNIKSNLVNNDKKILLIKDSFTHSMIPFLVSSYSDITMVDLRYFNQGISELINKSNFDDIVVIYNISNFLKENRFIFLCK